MKAPVTLVIMDGFGLASPSPSNAVSVASTPVLDALYATCAHTTLSASGEDVGLPAGQIGNSEVGHTNIGAGRIVYQKLTKIDRDIRLGDFYENPALKSAVHACKSDGGALHLMGLLSPGGVHSHSEHLTALLKLAKSQDLTEVYIHCFTDGRDVAPSSAIGYIDDLANTIAELGTGKIATIIGRFYAMDRDTAWDRVETAYNALAFCEGEYNSDPHAAVVESYASGVTDEFIKPIICDRNGCIKPGDTVVFYNFRPDRAREITRAFTDPEFAGFTRRTGAILPRFVCMASYDESMPNVTVAYPNEDLTETFGEILAQRGLTQLRTAETTKYAHVTFFFNGGVEDVFHGEDRFLVDTPTEFATFDLIPEMSAYAVTDAVTDSIRSGKYDAIIINLANCDMVGHTGVIPAAIRAVEVTDECVGRIVEAVKSVGGITLITADHGNAEQMLDTDGKTPMTAHTTNPVPFILVGCDAELHPGRLCDIAPTMLELMHIEKPESMTGRSLISALQ